MTWPQYRRRVCTLDGEPVRLSPSQAEVLSVLLMRHGSAVPISDLVDVLYPNPDKAPEWEIHTIHELVRQLRRRAPGVVRTEPGGYSIPLPGQFPLAKAA